MLLSYINEKGDNITLPDGDKLILQDWSGFAANNISLSTNKAPNQIGSTVVNKIYESRGLSIQFTIKESERQLLFNIRREVISVFSHKGTLLWQQNDGTIYTIDVEVESLEMPSGNARNNTFQTVQVNFLAPNPLWKAENQTQQQLLINRTTSVNNIGDIKTDCIIEVEGPINRPLIKNITNGAEIQLEHALKENEQLIIKTEFGNKEVLVKNLDTGRIFNAMRLLSLDSKLFYLEVGANVINVLSEITNQTSEARIKFYEKYLGV